jgi:hydroxymethylbilane synthase
MTDAPLILGTRGSALALAQTTLVSTALEAAFPGRAISIREVKTTGDQRQDLSLTHLAPGGHGYQTGRGSHPQDRVEPGLFTRELEAELLAGRIDAAVHSLKDLPTVMPGGLKLAAVLPRADTADVLILKTGAGNQSEDAAPLSRVPRGATIATSSLRRQKQLLHYRPDLRMTEIRGNVGTRLGKLRQRDDLAGLVLARAGLERLGLGYAFASGWLDAEGGRFAVEILTPDVMLPAAGQGAIGLQARDGDSGTLAALAAINHASTWAAVTLERELLRLLGGGCQLPLGVHTEIDEARGTLRLRAVLFGAGDEPPRFAEIDGQLSNPGDAAAVCAAALQAEVA